MSVGAEVEASRLLQQLQDAVGAVGVLTGAATHSFATDVYRARLLPLAVVRPQTIEQLQGVMRIAATYELSVVPRGGGASYTDGYLPIRENTLLIDTGRLDRIVEINERDGYVTVEAGSTWAALHQALAEGSYRTPFFGPFSGIAATIGGAMSQHAVSHGSVAYGISADSVLALDIVTATGDLIETGGPRAKASPFVRWYGPDLTGLFLEDCGSLGIKVRVTLPLVRRLPVFRGVSAGFDSLPEMAEFMRAVAIERLADEQFGIDSALAQGQIARQGDASSRLSALVSTWRAAPSAWRGIGGLAQLCLGGTQQFRSPPFTAHLIVYAGSQRGADALVSRIRQLLGSTRELPNSVAAFVQASPFGPLTNTLGPRGERWVPLHGILRHSQVAAFHAALQTLIERRRSELERLGIWHGAMFTTIGSSGFLYEVALYWPGPRTAYHRGAVRRSYLESLPEYPDNPEVAACVESLKSDLVTLYGDYGAVHFQIGKVYPYGSRLPPGALALVRELKRTLDPHGIMNPGALDLAMATPDSEDVHPVHISGSNC